MTSPKTWLAILFALTVIGGCERNSATDGDSVVVEASDFDQTCQTDSDCVLVPAGEQCGPCPACPIHAISAEAAPEFRKTVDAIECRTTQPRDGVACEPCIMRLPVCKNGSCEERAPTPPSD